MYVVQVTVDSDQLMGLRDVISCVWTYDVSWDAMSSCIPLTASEDKELSETGAPVKRQSDIFHGKPEFLTEMNY